MAFDSPGHLVNKIRKRASGYEKYSIGAQVDQGGSQRACSESKLDLFSEFFLKKGCRMNGLPQAGMLNGLGILCEYRSTSDQESFSQTALRRLAASFIDGRSFSWAKSAGDSWNLS